MDKGEFVIVVLLEFEKAFEDLCRSLLLKTLNEIGFQVEVNGYTSSTCEGTERFSNTTVTGAVIRSATVKVHPEGSVRSHTESAYFCANENLLISTADSFKYEWMAAPRNRQGMVLELKVGSNPSQIVGPIYIALSETQSPSDRMYRIAVGDADNDVTWIGRGKHGYTVQLNSTATPGILSIDEWITFWITWDNNGILFGKGSTPRNNTLIRWKMDKRIRVQHLGFASSWGNLAEFRIWNFNDEAGFSQVLHLDTPSLVLPGTEWGQLTVAGGLAFSTDVTKPQSGSLVEAVASLSSLMTLQHLGTKANETVREEAFKNLPGNVQTILSYKKLDNSFSEHQMLGSHKITLSILEALTKIQIYFGVDPDLIQCVKRWVQLRQEDDGRFSPLPADIKLGVSQDRIQDVDMKNITNSALLEYVSEITAETLMTLHDIGMETDADSETIQKAKIFLENSLPNIDSPEAIAAVTLALVLVRSATSAWAIEKLRNASTTEDGEFGWPHSVPRRDAADWLYESETEKSIKEPLLTSVEEYKASIYALITFSTIGDLKFAESVARYLFYRSHMLDRHPELLYPAVKAFIFYDSLTKDGHRSLTISLATSGMELTDTLDLRNERTAQILHLPSLPTKVFVYATGAGCATIQGKVTYSTYSTKSDTSLLSISSSVAKEVLPDKSSVEELEGKSPVLKIETCFRWKGPSPSGVLRMEVSLFSGFELVQSSPQLISSPEFMAEMQHGSHANSIWFVFANVSSPCPICVRYNARSSFIISALRPSYARIYPSGREDMAADTFFHTDEGSNLLKGITDDDLITWFGKNSSDERDSNLLDNCLYSTTTTKSSTDTTEMKDTNDVTTTQTTSTAENKELMSQLQKLEVLSVATYTINVDNETLKDENDTMSNEDESNYLTSTENIKTNIFTIKTTTADTVRISNKEDDDVLIKSNDIPHTSSNKTSELMLNKKEKLKRKQHKYINSKKINNVTEKDKTYMTTAIDTTQETTTKSVENSAKETIVSTVRGFFPKHINTKVQGHPIKYLNFKTTEEPKATFLPEIKNDKYVLLEKEEIWNLLKEIVNDERSLKKTTKLNYSKNPTT